MAHLCNQSIQEAEEERLQVWGQPGLSHEILFKNKQTKTKNQKIMAFRLIGKQDCCDIAQ